MFGGSDGTTPVALLNGMSPDPYGVDRQQGNAASGSCRYPGHDYACTALQPLEARPSLKTDDGPRPAPTKYSRMMVGCDLGACDFADFGTNSTDPKLCQQACDERPGCAQWTLTALSVLLRIQWFR